MQKQQKSSGDQRSLVNVEARELIRRGVKGSLATIDKNTGYPYASLITLATEADGTPLFLISTLARHTRNIVADSRASILFDGTDGFGDPLEGGRISIFGRAETIKENKARARFIARHPSAETYADFADFEFYRLRLEGAHFVGGFGRIHDLQPGELLTELTGADELLAAEGEIIEHMNADHGDAIELYATQLLGAPAGAWRLTGCDPDGCDLALGEIALRLPFPARVTSPQEIRKCLSSLAQKARG